MHNHMPCPRFFHIASHHWLTHALFGALVACSYPTLPQLSRDDAHMSDGAPEDGARDAASVDVPPADAAPPFASCMGLPANCGPSANENCCATATTIPSGTFYRGYDVAVDGMFTDMTYPATLSSFSLDKYEVTVGRFRKFVDVSGGTKTNPPAPGSGAHPNVPGSGWSSAWTANYLRVDFTALKSAVSSCPLGTWTDTPGANETLPIQCVTWFEAMAFCIWDGGYLPSEAEWNYAAGGGNQQRAYPWSPAGSPGSTAIDCSYANYAIDSPPGTYCGGTDPSFAPVGSRSPKGDGRWGQSDLAGNVAEWTLDTGGTYPLPCTDCANLSGSNRISRGGNAFYTAPLVRTAKRLPEDAAGGIRQGHGIRCARTP
jgi:formylglycine-generating enzyme required for sulfatase activity